MHELARFLKGWFTFSSFVSKQVHEEERCLKLKNQRFQIITMIPQLFHSSSRSFSLNGKVVVATGSAPTDQYEAIKAIHEAGATVVLTGSDRSQNNESILSSRQGRRTHDIALKLDSRERCRTALGKILNQFGRIDVLLHSNSTSLANTSPQGKKDPSSQLICSQIFGAHMANHGGGSILNLVADSFNNRNDHESSLLAHRSAFLQTRYLANYWRNENVRVNAICPEGLFLHHWRLSLDSLEGLIPLSRLSDSPDYQAAIVYLATDAAKDVSGSTFIIQRDAPCLN